MMDTKDKDKSAKPHTEKPVALPRGAVEVQPGVYVMPEVRSAFMALSAKPPKSDK
jgi:hypothetical protein